MSKQTQIVPPKLYIQTTETLIVTDAEFEDPEVDLDDIVDIDAADTGIPNQVLATINLVMNMIPEHAPPAASPELINLDENYREIQERCSPTMTSRFRRDSTIFRPMSTED